MNLEAITGMPSWYKIWLLNGCNHIRAKPILLREQERVHESFSSRRKSQMSRILIIPWNLAKLVKNCPGIIVNLHLAIPKQMVLLKEQYAESRENLCKWCCNQAWTKNGGRIPWDVIAICGTYKTSFWDGKTPFERRCGEPLRGTVIPCGTMVEHHSISAKDQARLHQFGEKVLLGTILSYALFVRGVYLERRHHGRRQ